MKEIKLTIDGKEVQLTKEQLRILGITIESEKTPFERVATGDVYYYITEYGEVDDYKEEQDCSDQNLYDEVNYFNDNSVARQVALHQLLYRKLLKFAYKNECEDVAWNGERTHWYIYYDVDSDKFDIATNAVWKQQGVYFSTRRGAERAIEEVVIPFMEEHPEFVW